MIKQEECCTLVVFSYCQTIPPYNPCDQMLADETTSGNSVNHFFPYSNGQGFHNGDLINNGFMKQLPSLDFNTRKELVEAVMAANGQMANGSMFSDNGQAFLQHFMATNPGGLMKLWWGGFSVIPDEVRKIKISIFGYSALMRAVNGPEYWRLNPISEE